LEHQDKYAKMKEESAIVDTVSIHMTKK